MEMHGEIHEFKKVKIFLFTSSTQVKTLLISSHQFTPDHTPTSLSHLRTETQAFLRLIAGVVLPPQEGPLHVFHRGLTSQPVTELQSLNTFS